MVRPIEQTGVDARRREQKTDIYRRVNFLLASRETQEAIVTLLTAMNELLEREGELAAQRHFFQQIHSHTGLSDDNGVDWDEVSRQILPTCFSDGGDMDGYHIVSRRVPLQITVFRALMDVPPEQIERF